MFKPNCSLYSFNMCGIAGFINFNGDRGADALANIANAMANTLAHRGPDHQGIWTDAQSSIALAHRRLSILDLSPCGNQPMSSTDGRYIIVYNGEIYNFRDIKTALENSGHAPTWRGHSDTEIMLAAIQGWGIETALAKFNGMFAFALYDTLAKQLFLARDRFGEKPLYYGWQQNNFLFGSELKALRTHPSFQNNLNHEAIAALLRFANIPAPLSIYADIHKLMPGHFAVLDLTSRQMTTQAYWSALDTISIVRQNISDTDETTLINQLDALLRNSVSDRMASDVPLGAFLSGGIDSSLIVAMMQAQTTQPVRSFSIGFRENSYNEAHAAKAVAHHLGTRHTEFYVTSDDARAVIPQLPAIYDEPFADSSQIVTYLVAKLAREHVTVALSGDGGDELFGGYNRYTVGAQLWHYAAQVPLGMRKAFQSIVHALPPQNWDAAAASIPALRDKNIGGKLHKLASLLAAPEQTGFHEALLSQWPEHIVKGASPALLHIQAVGSFTDTMMAHDAVDYLPNDILTKVDRATMASSLEGRMPFLDPALFEFAWTLPQNMKIRGRTGKYILRQVLARYVPPALTNRPKTGFAVPLADWLRGPLRAWADDLLSPAHLAQQNIFMPQLIQQRWREHLSGQRNWEHQLWTVLMFQAWHAQYH